MKKNNTKHMLNEQLNIGDKCSGLKNDPVLTLACVSGCFGGDPVAKTINNKLAVIIRGKDNRYAAFFGDYVPEVGGTMYIYNNAELTGPSEEKKWTCNNIEETLDASLSPDMINALNAISAYTQGNVVAFSVGMRNKDVITQGWTMTPLQQVPGYDQFKALLEPQLNVRLDKVYVWVKGAPRQKLDLAKGDKIIKELQADGWIDENRSNDARFIVINLKEKRPDVFKEDYFMSMNTSIQSDEAFLRTIKDTLNSVNQKFNKQNCRNLLNNYMSLVDRNMNINQTQITQFKPLVNRCATSFKFPFIQKKIDNLKHNGSRITPTNYKVDYSWGGMNESADTRIKNILRESLIEIKNLKKKSITEEKRISKEGFTTITEEFSTKKRYNPDAVLDRLALEYNRQESMGIPVFIIEQEMENSLLSSAFGGIWDSMKERIAKWIIGYLFPGQEDSEIAKIFIAAAGRLSVGELKNLMTCKGFVDFITATFISYGGKKLSENYAEGAGFLFDSVRNALLDTMQDSAFYNSLNEKLSAQICPNFSLGKIFQTLKT